MSELDFAAAVALLSTLEPGSDDGVCCYCKTVTREELLHDADERLWPMERLCEGCAEALQSDLDDELPMELEIRWREAMGRVGGLRADADVLLGNGWLDDE